MIKKEQINRTIAQIIDWKIQAILSCPKCESDFEGEEGRSYPNGVLCPECRSLGYTVVGVCHVVEEAVPNFCGDLNLMFLAEDWIKEDGAWDAYWDSVCKVGKFDKTNDWGKTHTDSRVIHAKPMVRAIAFILTFGKENDEK